MRVDWVGVACLCGWLVCERGSSSVRSLALCENEGALQLLLRHRALMTKTHVCYSTFMQKVYVCMNE